MTETEFKKRTAVFAVAAIEFVETLPRGSSTRVLGKQLLRCATSVGANYRSACNARSRSEMKSKMNIALEEADESIYWIELLVRSGFVTKHEARDLAIEAKEIAAMLASSVITLAKARVVKEPSQDYDGTRLHGEDECFFDLTENDE